MSGQLHHLLRMSVRPGLDLRIIPATAEVHGGQVGSFMLMEFTDFSPIVYLESEVSAVFLERPHQITAYQSIFTALADSALDRRESQELIAALATELYADQDDPPAGAQIRPPQ